MKLKTIISITLTMLKEIIFPMIQFFFQVMLDLPDKESKQKKKSKEILPQITQGMLLSSVWEEVVVNDDKFKQFHVYLKMNNGQIETIRGNQLCEMLANSGAKIGDTIEIADTGRQPVTVNAKNAKTGRMENKVVRRHEFNLSIVNA